MDFREENRIPETRNWEPGSLLKKVLDIVMKQRLVTGVDPSSKVIEFKHPHELEQILQLKISDEGLSAEEAETVINQVVKYSVRSQHPHCVNHQFHGLDEVGLVSSWLTEAVNTNQHTFETAPVFILMERFIISKLVEFFGWPEGDGVFSAGGTMSNTYGMTLARYKKYPDVKFNGVFGRKRLIAFASDQCHYWAKQVASLTGIGVNNVVIIPTDAKGIMIPEVLKEAIVKARLDGGDPFFVAASCGSTVLGCFDNVDEVADICQQEDVWLHVDACWGGSAILSKTHKGLLKGIERADSVAWNPHKMLCVPMQCSPFIVRHKGLLHDCNSQKATYLFHQDKFYDVSYDTGDKSLQCGRKADAIKLYFMLSFNGLAEIERRIDVAFDAARYFYNKVSKREGFKLVLEDPQFTQVCFWFIPPSLRGQEESTDWWGKLSKVAPLIKGRMVKEGTMMISYQPIPNKNLVNFFRMIVSCIPAATKEDMDFVMHEIERLGADL